MNRNENSFIIGPFAYFYCIINGMYINQRSVAMRFILIYIWPFLKSFRFHLMGEIYKKKCNIYRGRKPGVMEKFLNSIPFKTDLLDSIFNMIHDLVYIMRVEEDGFYYVFINNAAKKVMNLQDDVLGKRLDEVVYGELATDLNERYKQAVLSKSIVTYEDRVQIQNSTFIGETVLNPIINEDGTCQYVLAIVRDITERRKKEELLRQTKDELESNQKRLNSLFYNNPDLVFELDVQSRFVKVNSNVINVLGYQEEEILNQPFSTFVPPGEWRTVMVHFHKNVDGQNNEFYVWVQKKDGEKILLSVKNIPIIINGSYEGMYGIAKDITREYLADKELRETKEELQTFWNYTVDPVFLFQKGKILKVNPAFEKTFGFTEEEIKKEPTAFVQGDDPINEFTTLWEPLSLGKELTSIEIMRRTKTGKVLEFLASYTPVFDGNGKITSATAFYKNITDYNQSERELRSSEEKFKIITENVFDIILLVNSSLNIEYASPSTQEILGYDPEELIGRKVTEYIHPDDMNTFNQVLIDVFNKEKNALITEVRSFHKNGKWIWMEGTTKAVEKDGKLHQLVIVARDISQRKLQRDTFEKMAFYDFLTGLPNRRYFNDRLDFALENAKKLKKKVAVMLIDCHKLKKINDSFGHDAGDVAIKEMGMRLESCIREQDTAARIGGDEFGVIVTDLESADGAIEVAKRILRSLETPFTYRKRKINLEAGIGIAIFPDHATEKNRLFRYADKALYRTKERKENDFTLYRPY